MADLRRSEERVIDGLETLVQSRNNFQGILVEIQSQYGIGIFPLCDLEVAKKRSPMHHKLRAYTVWYANR
jgi:hypothetical protein